MNEIRQSGRRVQAFVDEIIEQNPRLKQSELFQLGVLVEVATYKGRLVSWVLESIHGSLVSTVNAQPSFDLPAAELVACDQIHVLALRVLLGMNQQDQNP